MSPLKHQFTNEILLEYEKIRDQKYKELEQRKAFVYSKIPKIKAIDEEIAGTGVLIAKTILNHPGNYEKALEEIQSKMEYLKQEKAILLTENNIPLDYLEPAFQCPHCKDTGYSPSGEKCSCFKQKLINRAYAMSNLSKILEKQNFQTFNIHLFSDEKFENRDWTPRQNMLQVLNVCEGFVHNFDSKQRENLLFYGTTGLGKTFMCNCIAKALLDKGKIVVYQTAFKILEILEDYKFNKNRTPDTEVSYQLLFDCDLLIIDDLGTELTNTFTNTEVFNILNTRLIHDKNILISTNLSPIEIANTYSDRIFSRIFGEFTILEFYGKDVRWEK
ncbi:DNA replication protein DnaC [Geosporobacter subterraneus DSM 17957]|uniref:DNA replication protein DnaC n=1 Tax=Geosporobacter subterraneus DSM 17957 TaxID=1121919 RepID=A0A1M6KF10_9FIRM|nr:DNA replication protein DnaC [Geosporobacter subterraneus DSM 17957]